MDHDDLRAVTADLVTPVMLRPAGVGDQTDDQRGRDRDERQVDEAAHQIAAEIARTAIDSPLSMSISGQTQRK